MGFVDDAYALITCPPIKWAIIILIALGALAPFAGPVLNGVLNAPIIPIEIPQDGVPSDFPPVINVSITPGPSPSPVPSPVPTLPGSFVEPSGSPGSIAALAHVEPVTLEERARCFPVNDTRIEKGAAGVYLDPAIFSAVAYHRGDVVPVSFTLVNLGDKILYLDLLSVTFKKNVSGEWFEFPFKYNQSVRWSPGPYFREAHDLLLPIPDVEGIQGLWEIDILIISNGGEACRIIKEVNIL